MSVSYNTGTAVSTTATGTSKTLTIPAGVLAGDGMLLAFTAYSESSGSSTLTVTSTGGTWTQVGSTIYESTNLFEVNSSLWYLSAGSSDPGATVTLHSTTALFIQAELVAYTGAASGNFVDASASANLTTTGTSFATPSASTVAANDWAVYVGAFCCDGNAAAAATAPSGTTIRQSAATTGGITCVSDNHTALAAGTGIGGGTFTTPVTSAGVTWSVAIKPAAAAPAVNSGMLLAF